MDLPTVGREAQKKSGKTPAKRESRRRLNLEKRRVGIGFFAQRAGCWQVITLC